jgi:hypothetical protein
VAAPVNCEGSAVDDSEGTLKPVDVVALPLTGMPEPEGT